LIFASGSGWFLIQIGSSRFLGLLLILTGVPICAWCFLDFVFRGKGTPAPIDPPKKLVIKGLYQYARNPMYIGFILILAGEAVWFESTALLVYASLFFLASHLFVVLYEEPTLRKKFGKEYENYYHIVPRWIPKIKRFHNITESLPPSHQR